MCFPLYITDHNEGPSLRAKRASHLGQEVGWSERVPVLWKSLTVPPIWIDVHRDHEAGAERWVGYDEEEAACYCRYRFHVAIGHTDRALDGVYSEDLAAWRMRDGRWLIHRIINSHLDGKAAYAFYAFSESMPR